MRQASFPSRAPKNEIESRTSNLPKWTLPLFIVAMTLCVSSFFFKDYWISRTIGHRMISVIESPQDFHNVTWDDLCLIPRMHMVSNGNYFADPRNSYNPDIPGWGISGIVAPLIGGGLFHLTGNYFLAMSVWGLVNFSLMTILIYTIFRHRPFEFSQAASLLGTFLLLNLLWIGGQEFERLDKAIPRALLSGYHFSLVELECGLFTYLPYILFLTAYWRFLAEPGWKKSVFLGGSAGFLSYVYFYHYIFAFPIIVGHILIAFALRRKKETLYFAGALGIGLIVAVPSILNSLALAAKTASDLYMQRLDYSPGRLPFQDYHWLLRLQIPLAVGIAYFGLRQRSEIKSTMLKAWGVLIFAYVAVLHLRVLLGFMQAVDHLWRVSLGIPASLWCILAVFDLTRSRLGQFKVGRRAVYISAVILPILILVHTTTDVAYSLRQPDVRRQLSAMQRFTLERLDCLQQVLKPGEGFLTVDPALNYHAMVNLEGVPFMALGLSPISVEELSERYLLSAYLTGRDNVQYPESANRETPEYTYEQDLHLYLYINLFLYPWSKPLEERVRGVYTNWNPENLDWKDWTNALATIKAVYIENDYLGPAMERIKMLFSVEKMVVCKNGRALRVNIKAVANFRQTL
ncbi:MAG: hypothetical protein PVG08_18600 [Desulfobacterales bacterium]|jgi:hypothetical protein